MITQNKTWVTRILIKTARALRIEVVLHGLAYWGTLTAGGLLGLLILDDLLHLPPALRLPLECVFCGFIGVSLFQKVFQPFFRPITLSQAARALEIKRGLAGNVLINSYCFSNEELDPENSQYVDAILDYSKSTFESIRSYPIWLSPRLMKWIGVLLFLLITWTVLTVASPRYVAASMTRIFLPLADVPTLGRWEIQVQPAGSVIVTKKGDLKVFVHVESLIGTNSKPSLPMIVWREGVRIIDPSPSAGDHANMLPGSSKSDFVYTFNTVNQPLSFRVWVDDSCSAAVLVQPLSLPRLKTSKFEVTPPTYTGLKTYFQPGPPTALTVPVGSSVVASFNLDPDPAFVLWRVAKNDQTVMHLGDLWESKSIVNDVQHYETLSVAARGEPPIMIAQGQITPILDHPPEVDFLTEDRSCQVTPNSKLNITVQASDDYGVASISLLLARSDDPTSVKRLKTWSLMGPPGEKEPAPESYEFEVDPLIFTPGSEYVLTAEATDFNPQGQPTHSRPIVLRVAGYKDLTVPPGDVLEPLFNIIKTLIAKQTKANADTDNLVLHLTETIASHDLFEPQKLMGDAQRVVLDSGNIAILEATKHTEADPSFIRLETLVNGEMVLALVQIGNIALMPESDLPRSLTVLQNRQNYILSGLIALLIQISTDRQELSQNKETKANFPPSSSVIKELMAQLKNDLKDFDEDQKMIITTTKFLKDLHSGIFTAGKENILSDLARTEADKGRLFQQKMVESNRLPLQDFAGGKVVSELNSVYQEIKNAADALYKKKSEVALAAEINSRQNAHKLLEELELSLKGWLPKSPDSVTWVMDESSTQRDAPAYEFPKEWRGALDDLLDQEEEIGEDNEAINLSGVGEEGLGGDLHPTSQQKLIQLAEQQVKIRQKSEILNVELQKQRKSTGDLATAINAMKQLEDTARNRSGIGLYQEYHQIMDALAAARNTCRGGERTLIEVDSTDSKVEKLPPEYKEMIHAYFKSLNEISPLKP